MTRLTHIIPVEAVRYSVTADGARTLAILAEQSAQLQPDAIAELGEDGWVATLVYAKPGYAQRRHHAHVTLAWAPRESVAVRV